MSRNDPRPIHVRYRDELQLIAVFLATLVPAVFVADMFSRATQDSPIAGSLAAIGGQIGFDQLTIGFGLLGFLIALLVLLFLDYQKRVQAILLGVATAVVIVFVFIDFDVAGRSGVPEIVTFVAGFLLGLLLIGGKKLRYIQISDTSSTVSTRTIEGRGQEPLTFPLAEKAFYYLLAVLLIFGFFEAHTNYQQPIIEDGNSLVTQDPTIGFELVDMVPEIAAIDLVASAVLFGTMWWFVGYDSLRSVFVLGPSGSGKTHLSIGMYLKAQELALRPRNATDGLTRLVQRMLDAEDFIPERTREAEDVSFQYTSGSYFSKNVVVDAFDYPGEYLPHIPPGIEVLYGNRSQYEYEDIIRDQVDEGVAIEESKNIGFGAEEDEARTDGGSESASSPGAAVDIGDEVIRERAKLMVNEVCPRVADADLLVLVVDMGRFLNDTPLGTEWYANILSRMPDDQEAVIVATKADLLLSEGEAGAQEMVDPAGLRERVDQSLRNHAGVSRLPIAEKPYPVFYRTYVEDGERKMQLRGPMNPNVPQRGQTQKRPSLYGYEQLLERLGR